MIQMTGMGCGMSVLVIAQTSNEDCLADFLSRATGGTDSLGLQHIEWQDQGLLWSGSDSDREKIT